LRNARRTKGVLTRRDEGLRLCGRKLRGLGSSLHRFLFFHPHFHFRLSSCHHVNDRSADDSLSCISTNLLRPTISAPMRTSGSILQNRTCRPASFASATSFTRTAKPVLLR